MHYHPNTKLYWAIKTPNSYEMYLWYGDLFFLV